ncbi:hypothetical protein IFR04_005091 [Cadophora malorum]|uniref:J domain-containing protein n=1 Tax=Cadophora malorum TaxID=108018 RepID=A0A8H7TM06_9HELO|nr:hypothetical protein IFR04_005091 [Cadophora malorum]
MSSSLRSSNNHAAESKGRFRSSSPITDWEDCESTADKWWWDEKLEDPQSYRSKAKKKDLPSEDPEPSKPNTKAKPKHKGTTKEQFKSKSHARNVKGQIAIFINFIGTEQDLQALGRTLYGAEYDALLRARRAFHAHPERNPFPKPKIFAVWAEKHCMKADSLRCCHHDLGRTLHGSGKFSQAWLKKERLLCHPDKFAGKADAAVYAAEMFKMIQRMIDGPSKSTSGFG